MDEKELKKIVVKYFGLAPSQNLESLDIERVHGEGDMQKVKIRWEEHIGNLSGMARISPLDILYELGWKNTEENIEKAVRIMINIAKKDSLPLVRVGAGSRYLMVNPKYSR